MDWPGLKFTTLLFIIISPICILCFSLPYFGWMVYFFIISLISTVDLVTRSLFCFLSSGCTKVYSIHNQLTSVSLQVIFTLYFSFSLCCCHTFYFYMLLNPTINYYFCCWPGASKVWLVIQLSEYHLLKKQFFPPFTCLSSLVEILWCLCMFLVPEWYWPYVPLHVYTTWKKSINL